MGSIEQRQGRHFNCELLHTSASGCCESAGLRGLMRPAYPPDGAPLHVTACYCNPGIGSTHSKASKQMLLHTTASRCAAGHGVDCMRARVAAWPIRTLAMLRQRFAACCCRPRRAVIQHGLGSGGRRRGGLPAVHRPDCQLIFVNAASAC